MRKLESKELVASRKSWPRGKAGGDGIKHEHAVGFHRNVAERMVHLALTTAW